MPRLFIACAALALFCGASSPAFADGAPDAAQVRQAAEQFDAGVAAYKQRDFEGAASRFEAADAAVPSAKTLRQAIRARLEGGQGSRAATLAALALTRYPGDEATLKLAKETIAKVEPSVHKLNISCASPCVLALGTRSVPGDANTRWVVYVDPGKVAIGASFFGGVSSARQEVDAAAGKSSDLRFEPAEKPASSTLPAAPLAATKNTPPVGVAGANVNDSPRKASGIHPAAFIVGAAATAGLAGVTLWSGLDTRANPGPDVVRVQCVGQGESCPAYQDGRRRQARTNILLGASAGAAAATVVLAIFTRWHGSARAGGAPVEPTALITDRGAVLGAAGIF